MQHVIFSFVRDGDVVIPYLRVNSATRWSRRRLTWAQYMVCRSNRDTLQDVIAWGPGPDPGDHEDGAADDASN